MLRKRYFCRNPCFSRPAGHQLRKNKPDLLSVCWFFFCSVWLFGAAQWLLVCQVSSSSCNATAGTGWECLCTLGRAVVCRQPTSTLLVPLQQPWPAKQLYHMTSTRLPGKHERSSGTCRRTQLCIKAAQAGVTVQQPQPMSAIDNPSQK